MKLGIAYYPEYNSRRDWGTHFEQIRDAGIKRVRMAEFSWSLLQPEKDTYNWSWLDDSIQTAEEYGIEIILGTPTACPPIWLVEEFPEVMPVNREGRRSGFGARQHRCFNSAKYIAYSRNIVEKLGERYGKHPNVAAWQIDNELGGEQKRCYCDNCRKEFQHFLSEKYHRVEELNERWGNQFWSQSYQQWSQIPVPMRFASDMDMNHHPSLELEFTRFSSKSIVDFCNMQVDILRKYTDKDITTNTDTFRFGDNVNVYELFKSLDIAGMDIYSDSLLEIGFYSDLTRSVKNDKFWMMEFGTGSPNLYNEMELIHKSGCEWFMPFTFIPFASGQEQGFKGLVTMTGELEPNYHVIKQWADNHREEVSKGEFVQPKVGIYYDFDSSWAYWISTWASNIEDKLVYPKYMVNTVYRSLFEENIAVQFAFTKEKLQELQLLILPWQIIYNAELEAALIEFVGNGGKLIVTSDLFRKNTDNVYFRQLPPLYKTLLNWEGNDFINDSSSQETILLENKYGSGQVWVVKKDCTVEQWKGLLNDVGQATM
ncbi:MAG: beta-galactosidase [Gorillibacterium sp.]|nr:beta-galactosidase [Gorillibacterium sp.]